MKKVVLSIILLLLCVIIIAQTPESFSYQAIVRDGGNVVSNQAVSYQFSIIKGVALTDVVYTEKHSITTNQFGLVNLAIGNGTDKIGDFSAIDWGADVFFLKVEIDPAGGTSYVDMGTTQLLSVPYAIHAKTSDKADALELKINKISNTLSAGGMVTDIDGNSYNTVKIGTQIWMSENLKTTKYNDGTPIPNITDDAAWAALKTGAYCDHDNTPSNSTIYGRLYNWYAVDNNALTKVASNGGKNVCPTGWHVPSSAEWTALTTYLTENGYGYGGSGDDIGKSMANTSGWDTSPTAGNVGNDQASNNSSGFTAFSIGGRAANWWSSKEMLTTRAYGRLMVYDNSIVYLINGYKYTGFSVRCLRD